MKAESLTNSQETSWGWFRKSEAPTENVDPQAVVSLGAMSIETSKRDKTLNPDWGLSEIHDLVVTDREKQKLRIVLRDASHGYYSTKPSDFLGQVDVPVKDLTNCVDTEKVLQLSGAKSPGGHGQLILKAQFRELANPAPDTKMGNFLKMQEWDFGIPQRTGVLLMADIFYASGLPPCEDNTSHWAEVKISGHRRTTEEGPIERKTPEMPARTGLQHGRELASSFGPDLRSVLPTETKDDLGLKIWRKNVQISADAQRLDEERKSQLVDVVFDTPFSFLLDSVKSATIEIAIFRSKKAGWRAKEDHKKECVGRIEGRIADLQKDSQKDGDEYKDGIFFTPLTTSSSSSSSSSAAGEEELGHLRWRLQARQLMKKTEPKPEESRREARPSWLPQQCFRGIRPTHASGPESFEPEVVTASQEEEQKPEEPTAEATVEQPVARSWWWPFTFAGAVVPKSAESATSVSQEDSVAPQQDIPQHLSSDVLANETQTIESCMSEPEEAAGKAAGTSSSVSWLWGWWPRRGSSTAPRDADKKQAPATGESSDTTLALKVSAEANSAEPRLAAPQVEQSESFPIEKSRQKFQEKPQAMARKSKSGRQDSWPPRVPVGTKSPKARGVKAGYNRSRSVSTTRAPISGSPFAPTDSDTSDWVSPVRPPNFSGEPLGESDSQVLSKQAPGRHFTPTAVKAEDNNAEIVRGSSLDVDSCRQESSLESSTDISANYPRDETRVEGAASTSYWAGLGRIVQWRRRGPANSTSPSARSRIDHGAIPTSNSAPDLSEAILAQEPGLASEVARQPASSLTATLTSEVSADEDDSPAVFPHFQG